MTLWLYSSLNFVLNISLQQKTRMLSLFLMHAINLKSEIPLKERRSSIREGIIGCSFTFSSEAITQDYEIVHRSLFASRIACSLLLFYCHSYEWYSFPPSFSISTLATCPFRSPVILINALRNTFQREEKRKKIPHRLINPYFARAMSTRSLITQASSRIISVDYLPNGISKSYQFFSPAI